MRVKPIETQIAQQQEVYWFDYCRRNILVLLPCGWRINRTGFDPFNRPLVDFLWLVYQLRRSAKLLLRGYNKRIRYEAFNDNSTHV